MQASLPKSQPQRLEHSYGDNYRNLKEFFLLKLIHKYARTLL